MSKSAELASFYNLIESEDKEKPIYTNKGPFSLFCIIDGHRGTAVAQFIKDHLMEVVYRNRDIMVRRRFQRGLKNVFIKMEELLACKEAQLHMNTTLGWPQSKAGSIFEPVTVGDRRPRS